MTLQIIMWTDISDDNWDKHHIPMFCHTDDLEVDLALQRYLSDASENDYYYTTEMDFEWD